MPQYDDHWFKNRDGLNLYARDYRCTSAHKMSSIPIVCIPGLTRNSADFALLCEHLSSDFRVIAVDLRGRGKSDYDPSPENYRPDVYAHDMLELLDSLNLPKVVLIGTSLGGFVSMLLNATVPARVASVILNDIGPETHQPGLDRIKSYISNRSTINSWEEAIANTREIFSMEYPNFTDADWEAFTRNLYRQSEDGKPELNYDFAIATAISQSPANAQPTDLWPAFEKMRSLPTLLIRGELSDILTLNCVARMRAVHPEMEYTEVPSCGHTPLLTEPECLTSIDQFLGKCAAFN